MDVRIMEYMVAIEEEGSLARAAERIHISQSALSQSLSKLEQELGGPLFVKTGRRQTPTEIGKIYLRGARELLKIKEDTYDRIKKLSGVENQGIRMSICSQAAMLYKETILAALREKMPHLRLELHQTIDSLATKYLLSGVMDIAIHCVGQDRNSMLDYVPLYTDRLVLAVPEKLAWSGKGIDYSRLQAMPFIYPDKSSYIHKAVDSLLLEKHLIVNSLYRADSVEDMATLVRHGYGSAFLPLRVAQITPGCKVYRWNNSPEYTLCCVVPRHGQKDERLQQIIEIIKSAIK